jgi:hypothetical protein
VSYLSCRVFGFPIFLFWASSDEGYFERHLMKVILSAIWWRLFWAPSDEIYSRNASCALNLISTFLLLSLDRHLCWWSISLRGYHQPSSQWFGTDMVYQIYIYYWNLQFLNNAIINKAKVLLPQFDIYVFIYIFVYSMSFSPIITAF